MCVYMLTVYKKCFTEFNIGNKLSEERTQT